MESIPIKPISVYVRLGATDDSRVLRFKRPPELSDRDLLDRQVAIDGDNAVISIYPIRDDQRVVTGYYCGFLYACGVLLESANYLSPALCATELTLLNMLEKLGYEVAFL
jgi:hypothetical protein